MKLIAYQLADVTGWTIEPAQPTRAWMDRTPHKYAYRCLPMTMANQMGWVIRSPISFWARWNGSPALNQIEFGFHEAEMNRYPIADNHFGCGILTFHIPWLFRTEDDEDPELGLIVRGLPNYVKDCIHPLEGYVETHWCPFTFTMNWQITHQNTPIMFLKDDPICFIQPYPIKILEGVVPEMRSEVPAELMETYNEWSRSRDRFNADPRRGDTEWQRYYHQGGLEKGEKREDHRLSIKLQTFAAEVEA